MMTDPDTAQSVFVDVAFTQWSAGMLNMFCRSNLFFCTDGSAKFRHFQIVHDILNGFSI
jgi:hypothetical protein